MYFIFVLVLVLIFIFVYPNLNPNWCIEKFNVYQTFQSFVPVNTYKYPMYPLVNPPNSTNSVYSNSYFIPYFLLGSNGYTNLPWWNTSLGNTSNMSYDLRGDPVVIPKTNFAWNNGTNFPIYNQSV